MGLLGGGTSFGGLLRHLLYSSALAFLISLAVNYLAVQGHLSKAAEPDAATCDDLSHFGRTQRIETYDDFYPFYLCEHSQPGTKLLHFIGTFNVVTLLLTQGGWRPKTFAVGLVQAYTFAWLGHYFVEFNRPATFKYPQWSFVSDWVMFRDLLRGRCRMW